MRFLILSILSALLSSCAIGKGVRALTINGESVFEAKCNGTARTYADCLEQASNKCSEYGKKAVSLNSDGSSTLMTINNQLVPVVNRSLLFKCE